MAWLAGWTYRKEITVTNANADYQTKVLIGKTSDAVGEDVDCGGHIADDFDDLRFTAADGTTLLDYWIESVEDSGGTKLATVWVQNNSTPDTTLYMYYNGEESAVSSGVNTFPFFDDFDDASLDTDKWQETTANGSYSESGGILTVTAGAGSPAMECISSKTATYGAGYALRTRAKADTDKIQWVAFVTNRGSVLAKEFTTAFRKHSSQANFSNISGDDTNFEEVSTGIARDTTYRVWECRRLNGVDDAYYQNDAACGTGQYDTNQARYIDIGSYHESGATIIDWIAIRKYAATEPSFSFGSEETEAGWTGKIVGVTNPAKIMGIAVANISKVNGVS